MPASSILPLTKHRDRGWWHEFYRQISPLLILQKSQVVLIVLWLCIFTVTIHRSTTAAVHPEHGPVQRLSCTSVHWTSADQCGLDGRNCRPFEGKALAFRCPKGCDRAVITDPRYVGDKAVNHRPFVIGGAQTADEMTRGVYRGDSFICAAAIHAGVVAPQKGGCGLLRRRGEHAAFPGSLQNGIESIGFNGRFPLSFSLERLSSSADNPACQDPTTWLLFCSVVFTCLFLFITTSRSTFFSVTFMAVFFHVAFVSDSPDEPEFLDFNNVVSVSFGRALTAVFVAYWVYNTLVKKTLDRSTSSGHRLLWTTTFWIGALQNLMFGWIANERLTSVDIAERPHAIFSVVVILIIICVAGGYQLTAYWRRDLARFYVWSYLFLLVVLFCIWRIPGQNLHLHHYFWPLLLLPGTSLPTVPSTIFQGFLLGISVNGMARWGPASILETTASLFPTRMLGNPVPYMIEPVISETSVKFSWDSIPAEWDGVQVIVNEVLRWQGFRTDDVIPAFTWPLDRFPQYFRFCANYEDLFRGLSVGTCSDAGTLIDSQWQMPIIAP